MMKVKVSFTLDIDSKAWQAEYGIDPADVRADVQQYIENSVVAHLSDAGLIPLDIDR